MTFKIGAHVSIAGGFSKVAGRLEEINANCGQIFVHSPRGWSFPRLDEEDVEKFKEEKDKYEPVVVHASYLINLAASDEALRQKGIQGIKKESAIMNKLEIKYLIVHSGSNPNREEGKKQLKKSLKEIINETNGIKILLENSSGAGNLLNNTFEEWSEIINEYKEIGACLDTCHAHAAGYDMKNIKEIIKELEKNKLIDKIEVVHLNDSRGEMNSKLDRHEHLGQGTIGKDGIKKIINSELKNKIFILETPTDENKGFKENIEYAKKLRE